MSVDEIIFETIKAYCLRQNRENYRPPHDLFVAFQLFAEDMIRHALMEENAEHWIPQITDPIVNLLADWTKTLPKLKQGPFTTPIAPLIDEEMVYDTILRFNHWPIKGPNLYASLRQQLNENSQVNGLILTPKDNKEFTPQHYFRLTPFMRLVEASSPFSFRDFKATNGFFIGAPGSGKTSHIISTVWDHLQESDPPPMLIIDPHNQMADEIESLAYWKDHPGKLVHIDPRATPALNLLDLPKKLNKLAAAGLTDLYDNLFSVEDTKLTGIQSGVFPTLIAMLLEKRQADDPAKDENTTILDAFDYLDDPKDAKWEPHLSKLARRARRTLEGASKQSLEGIRARLAILDSEPNLSEMFSAKSNKIDLYDMLHVKRQTVLVSTRGLIDSQTFLRYVMLSAVQAAFRRDDIPEPKRFPILVFIDEAGEVFTRTDLGEKIIRQCRKFGLWSRTYAQDLASLHDRAFVNLLLGFSGVKIAAAVLEVDADPIAKAMRCDDDFVSWEHDPQAPLLKFAVRVPGLVKKSIHIYLPNGRPIPDAPRMSPEEHRDFAATLRRALQDTAQAAPEDRSAPHADQETTRDKWL